MAEENTTDNTPKKEMNEFDRVWDDFLEHNRRAFEESGKAIESLLPEGFKEHGAVARDEFRKGAKVLVDYAIDELEKLTKTDLRETDDTDDEPPSSTTGKTKVKVQVE